MVYTLTVAADMGSSLGKGCYTIDKGPPNDAEDSWADSSATLLVKAG